MSEFDHVTVLPVETVAFVAPASGGIYVDCTLGGGGHAERILEASSPDGQLIGIDRDQRALDAARKRLERFGSRAKFAHAPFGDLAEVLDTLGIAAVHGIVADLGVSSPQLDDAERGFSIMRDGPLDMRMDPTSGESALELIERLEEDELANVIFEYGEERKSRGVARSIKAALRAGQLATTDDLARAVRRVVGPRKGRIDPATRTFQGLRIAVNGELDELRSLCATAPDRLHDGGVLAIISFHSLEDRIVKHGFREDARLTVLTKKPCEAGDAELAENPRSRSAKLRAARRNPREAS
jgi:16S rRNA (cytosine1402-N4)-methyltransferase